MLRSRNIWQKQQKKREIPVAWPVKMYQTCDNQTSNFEGGGHNTPSLGSSSMCGCLDEKGHSEFTSVCINAVWSTFDTAERPPGLAQHARSPPAEEEELLIDKYSIRFDGAISKAQAGSFCSYMARSLTSHSLL